MNQNQIDQALKISLLFKKYLKDELTLAERRELEQWLQAHPQNSAQLRQMMEQSAKNGSLATRIDADKAFDKLLVRINAQEERPTRATVGIAPYYKWFAAAVLLVALTAALLLYNNSPETKINQQAVTMKSTASQSIELVLANGNKVNLEAHNKGVIAAQGQYVATKQTDNLLSFQLSGNAGGAQIAENNKLAVPRGKQFQLVLPDGSKVWLNAQTTLSFPSSFGSSERVVELTGEAYFEIEHHDKWPFRVKTAVQTVEVLGTHFNVSAYPEDNRTITTLASGRVKVSDAGDFKILKPGQLAVKNNAQPGFDIATADLEETLGWKNGLFVFKDGTIEDLMQVVERAYDVDVQVDAQVRGRRFGGTYPLKSGLNNLLSSLEKTNVIHYKVEGRRVSIMP